MIARKEYGMERLKEFRKEKSLTQEQMANKLGFTLSMYEKVESGRAGCSAAFMKRLKTVYPDADIDFLFFGDDSKDVAV